MKLLRLKRLEGHRIFRDFAWSDQLLPFGRYNVIYGWNGCGKTTLSSLLARLQSRANVTEGKVRFEFDTGIVEGSALSDVQLPPVRVFNRDFQQKNLLETGSELSPIYVLGQEDSAKQQEIDKSKAERESLTGELERLARDQTKAANELRKFCEKKAKSIKESLQGGSAHRYNSYDRAKLQTDLDALTPEITREKQLGVEQRKSLRAEKDANPADLLETLSSPADSDSVHAGRVRELLSTEVVAHRLDELVQNQALNRWVQEGLPLHAETTACGFCGGGVSSDRLEALRAHFNESLKQLQDDLRRERDQVRALTQRATTWSPPDETRLYEDLRNEYLIAKSLFCLGREKWLKTLALFEKKLDQRLGDIFHRLDLQEHLDSEIAVEGASIAGAVQSLNEVIARHNQRTEHFADSVSRARDTLAWSFIADCFEEYTQLQSEVRTSTEASAATRQQLAALSSTVTKLEREMREHRQAADDLNADLHSYLGRTELEFVPEESGYSVRRHGHRALHLSEGEKTAITFLYFLKTLHDQSFDISNGVVVIDDPVSSLDSNALFSAFGYMKERTKNCSQLFILTHNFSFFRQVKNWFHSINNHVKKDGVPKEDRPPARLYQLSTTLTESEQPPARSSTLSKLDPMLEEFESEYHYLFKTVFLAQRDGLSSLEQAFPIPNMARRLLEAFLAFRYPQRTGGNWLFAAMSEVTFDEGKKNRVLRYLNTHSHTGMIDDGAGDPWGLGEVQEVLSDILDLIKSEDPCHYGGMVAKVTAKEEAA